MRNIPKPLSESDARHQTKCRDILAVVTHRDVKVDYTKRDGSKGSATGKVAYFNGKPGFDTGSVTIDTVDKGPRTINLHRITNVE